MSEVHSSPESLTDAELETLASRLDQQLSEMPDVAPSSLAELPRPHQLQAEISPVPVVKPYHHGDLHEALLQATLEMIRKKGVQGLSLRAVAQAVGVSPAAPYRHFADKQELIAAVAARGFRQMSERLAKVPQGGPLERLKALAQVYFQYCCDFPDTFALMFGSTPAAPQDYPELQKSTEETFIFFLQEIQLAQEAGLFRTAPVEYIAMTFWSQLHGFTSLIVHQQILWKNLGKDQPDELLAVNLELLLQGLLRPT